MTITYCTSITCLIRGSCARSKQQTNIDGNSYIDYSYQLKYGEKGVDCKYFKPLKYCDIIQNSNN